MSLAHVPPCAHCGRPVEGEAFVLQRDGGMVMLHSRCHDGYQALVHRCPKCKATGKMDHPLGETESVEVPLAHNETPGCAWLGCWGCQYCRSRSKLVVRVKRVTCDLCSGKGRLSQEPVPVTEVTGWKLSDE